MCAHVLMRVSGCGIPHYLLRPCACHAAHMTTTTRTVRTMPVAIVAGGYACLSAGARRGPAHHPTASTNVTPQRGTSPQKLRQLAHQAQSLSAPRSGQTEFVLPASTGRHSMRLPSPPLLPLPPLPALPLHPQPPSMPGALYYPDLTSTLAAQSHFG